MNVGAGTLRRMTLAEAVDLAASAHLGQTDKAGHPYIDHALRVMAGDDDEFKMAAVLHDVVEDTTVTIEHLRSLGCPERVSAGRVTQPTDTRTSSGGSAVTMPPPAPHDVAAPNAPQSAPG